MFKKLLVMVLAWMVHLAIDGLIVAAVSAVIL